MKRYILTGAPGAGKTAVIRQLGLDGFSVVEEAATDVLAAAPQAWLQPSFIDDVAALQRDRQIRASDEIQFHDRSAVCTLALARHLGYPVSTFLDAELGRIKGVFEKRVFFIRNLGFITPTEARRITLEDALRFEKVHEETYLALGYELVYVEPGSIAERVRFIEARCGLLSRPPRSGPMSAS